jgi:ferredoxin
MRGWFYDHHVGLEVEIDRDACMGSGQCVFGAPGAFDLDDESIAFVVDPAGAPEDQVIDAGRNCPARAITVRRDGVPLV